jgi:diadenosine tetraphosphate (Ap4A) HIT family hydrolase
MNNNFILHENLAQDCIEVCELPLCKVLIMNDSQYPWFILVPKVSDILDIYQLEWEQQVQFLNESSLVSEVLMEIFNGTKMNVAALGNICPQLHVHHIVRFEGDACWPKPVWGTLPNIPYNETELDALIEKVGKALSQATN